LDNCVSPNNEIQILRALPAVNPGVTLRSRRSSRKLARQRSKDRR
jgi:hypothetical protein